MIEQVVQERRPTGQQINARGTLGEIGARSTSENHGRHGGMCQKPVRGIVRFHTKSGCPVDMHLERSAGPPNLSLCLHDEPR